MWPIHLAFRFLISCRIFLCSLTLSNTSLFLTWSHHGKNPQWHHGNIYIYIFFFVKPIFINPISYTLGASLHAAKKTSFKHMGLCKVSSGRGMRNVKQKKPHKYAGGHDCLKGSLQHCGQSMTSRYLPVTRRLRACWYSFHLARRIKST